MASEGGSAAVKRSGTALDSDDEDDTQVARHVSKKPRNRYVMDEADESDGEGGVAKDGDDDGGSVDSYEDDGFVDKSERAEKAEVESSGSDDNESSSDDDSDSSDDSDSGSDAGNSSSKKKKKPKRRLIAKRAIDLDDAALLADNAADGMAAAGHVVNDGMADFLKAEEERKAAALAARAAAADDNEMGDFLDDDDIDSEGMDEFIVQEDGRRAPKRKRATGLYDTGLDIEQQQNLEELFGADAPAAWFGEGAGDAAADEEYVENVLGSVFAADLEHERREATKNAAVQKEQRRAAAREGRGAEAKLKGSFEPGALSKGFLSQADAVLTALDVPERMTVSLAVRNGRLGGSADATMQGLPEPVAEGDRAAEAAWAAEHLAAEMWASGWNVSRHHVCSGPYFSGFADEAVYGPELVPPAAGSQQSYVPDPSVIAALTDSVQRILTNVLDLKQEVPMVWAHRRDDFSPALALCHVWRVVDLDERWVRLAASARMVGSKVNERLMSLAQMGITEEATAEAAASLAAKEAMEEDRVQATAPAEGEATTAEHRSALRQLLRLRTQREAQQLALAAISPAAMESISAALRGNVNDEEGVADAGMAARLALVKAHALKAASNGATLAELLRCGGGNGRLSVYATLQKASAAVIANAFTLTADDVAANLQARSQVVPPPTVDLEEVNNMLEAHVGQGFDSEEKVLKAARMCAAVELATHPQIRQGARAVVRRHLCVSATATARGSTEMDSSHPAYGLQALRDKPLDAFHHPPMPVSANEALRLVEGFGGAAQGAGTGTGVPGVDLHQLLSETQQLLQEEAGQLDEPVDEFHPRVETSVRLRRPQDGVVCGFGHGSQMGTILFKEPTQGGRLQLQNPLGLPPFGQESEVTLLPPRTGGLAQWLLLLRAQKENMLKVELHLGAHGARMDGRTPGGIPPGPFMPGQAPPTALALNRPAAKYTESEAADLAALDGEAVLVAWLAPAVLSALGLAEWVAQAAATDGNGAPLLPPIVASRPQAGVAFPGADPSAPVLTAGACVPSVIARVTLSDAADSERLFMVRQAVREILLPELLREARKSLTKQAREVVVGQWACELRHRVLTAPFRRPPLRPREDPSTDLVGGTLDMSVAQAAEEAAMAEEGAGRWDSRPRVLVIAAPLPGVRDASVAASLGRDGRVLDMTPLPARKDEAESAIMECMITNPPDVVVVAPSGGMRVRWLMRDTVQNAARRAYQVIEKARKVVRETLRQVAKSGGSLSAVVVGADSSQLNLESESIASVRAAVRGGVAGRKANKKATGAGLFTPEAFVPGGRLAGLQHLVSALTPWVMGGKWAKRFFRYRPAPPSVQDPDAPFGGAEQLTQEEQNAVNTLPILLGDGDVPPVLARSDVYQTELPDARDTMRLAVATGRYLQNPLVALSVLWPLSGSTTAKRSAVQAGLASTSRAVLGLQLHPLQDMAPEARLLRAGERVMVEAVSATGVDVNSVLRLPHAVPLLQFVPGLGPRKVKSLLDKALGSLSSSGGGSRGTVAIQGLEDKPQLRSLRDAWPTPIVSRASLLTNGWLTNTVYYNAASFLRIPDPVVAGAPLPIDFDDEQDEGEGNPKLHRDPLDATALHPDTYSIAAQLCGAVNTNLAEGQRMSNVIDRADDDVDLAVPRSYRALVRHVARYSRFCLVQTLLEWTADSSFAAFKEPVGMRQGQLVAGPHGSMPPEEYFPGVLREPGIVPMAKLHAAAAEQGLEVAEPPVEPKDPLADFDLHQFAKSLEDSQADAGKTVRRTLHRLLCVVQQMRQPSVPLLLPFYEPAPAAAFRMLSGESTSSLHPGAVLVGRIGKVMPHRVVVRLDCGVSGSLNADSAIDPQALPPGRQPQDMDLTQLFASGQNLHVRVCKVDYPSFNVVLTALPGRTALPPALPPLDPHVDPVALRLLEAAVAAELKETVADAQDERVGAFRARTASGATRVLRPINHPSFQNVTSREAEEKLAESPLYSYLVRPSSKGPQHLTITWKFADAPLFVHINVDEQDKDPNSPDGAAALGRTLVVGKRWDRSSKAWVERKYEDLDELLAMHMERLSAYMRDFTGHVRFRAVPQEMLKQELLDMKAANPSHLPYLLHYGTGDKLGRVAITILVSSTHKKTHTEYIAVEPEGFRWAGTVSTTVTTLLNDFKQRVLQVLRQRSAKSKQARSGAGGSSSAASPGRSRWGGVAASPGAEAGSQYAPGMAYNAGMAPM